MKTLRNGSTLLPAAEVRLTCRLLATSLPPVHQGIWWASLVYFCGLFQVSPVESKFLGISPPDMVATCAGHQGH